MKNHTLSKIQKTYVADWQHKFVMHNDQIIING